MARRLKRQPAPWRAIAAAVFVAVLCLATTVPQGGRARSQAAPDDGLRLTDQTFAVSAGSMLHLTFTVAADVPEIVAPTTSTTTTTTTTTLPGTSTTTTTTLPPCG